MVYREHRPTNWLWSLPLVRCASRQYKDVAASYDDQDSDSDHERAFDIADTLENGFACEIVTDFMHPLRRASKLWRFQVKSDDSLRYRLFTDDGDFLMYAQAVPEARKVQFFLYQPNDKVFDPNRPAFTMSWNEKQTEWRVVQDKCENCQFSPKACAVSPKACACRGKQQVAFIKHSRMNIGDGDPNRMEVRIPGFYSDKSRVIWCPKLGRSDLGSEPFDASSQESQQLVTKAPVWNNEVGGLVLDFQGRSVLSSAKNFQLSLGQRPEHVICQYGKIDKQTFSLDFRYPLSSVQAFAISLTTMFWEC